MTASPVSSAALTATSSGSSVMSVSFCPLTGSRHSAHGQLSRSQTAGKRSMCPSASSSRSGSFWLVKQASGLLQMLPARKVGYTCYKLTILTPVRLTQRIVVIGGGAVGTMHAVAARRRGYEGVHLERDGEA